VGIVIEAIPDRPEALDESTDTRQDAEVASALQFRAAYEKYYAQYEREVAGTGFVLKSISVKFKEADEEPDDEELDEEEISFDFSLFEALLEIYVLNGWSGILTVEKELDARLTNSNEDQLPGGVSDEQLAWKPVKGFFRFTCNLIALMIREALIAIEQKAASAIVAHLSEGAQLVSKTYTEVFDFQRKIDPSSKKVALYRCGNRKPSDRIFAELTKAVQLRDEVEKTLEKVANERRKLESLKTQRSQSNVLATPYTEVGDDQNLADEASVATKKEELLKAAERVAQQNTFGLIVIDSLPSSFKQEAMEQKLGAALWALYQKIDEIGRGIDPGEGRIARLIPGIPAGEIVAWDAVVRWQSPGSLGLERYLVDIAVDKLPSDPGWFPLAHEPTWHRLVESGAIAKDSFEYVIYLHYLISLIERVEALRAQEEQTAQFWKSFSKLSATVSLGLLVTPATAPVAGAARVLSFTAHLINIAHQVYSVVDSLQKLDGLLAQELVRPDAFVLRDLSRVGELAQLRSTLLDDISEVIAFEIVSEVAGKWGLVKVALLTRSVMWDLEILLLEDKKEDDGQ